MPLLFQNATPFQASFERDLFESGALTEPPNVQNLVVLSRLTSLLQGHITKDQALEGLPILKQQGLSIIFHIYEEFLVDLPPLYQEDLEEYHSILHSPFQPPQFEIPHSEDLPLPFILPQELHPYITPPNSPTNQEMHALNGNIKHLQRAHPYVMNQNEAYAAELGNLGLAVSDAIPHKYIDAIESATDLRENNKSDHISSAADYIMSWLPKSYQGQRRAGKGKIVDFQKTSVPALTTKSGPSNTDMHSYNGNIKPRRIGPITQKQHERVLRRRLKRKNKKAAFREKRVPKPRAYKPAIAKAPRGVKAAAAIETKEQRLARSYTKFLKSPVFEPPRLGSTGNTPTLLVHGYFRRSYSMASPGVGTVANATCVTAAINPVIFAQIATDVNYVAPVVVNFTTAGSVVPTVANATGQVSPQDFINSTALKNQVIGNSTQDLANPLARWVGGSITLTCRCPMATTAPPFLFGGLLPEYPAVQTSFPGSVKVDSQISSFAIDNIRNLPSTVEVPGFTVSSVYIPSTPEALNFNSMTARNTSATRYQPISAIPYVGMSNCPTTAVIEVTVSSWFEVQQNVYYSSAGGGTTITTADYGGWRIGPKLSSEDVFDHIPRFNPVSNKMIGMGAKANTAASGYSAMMLEKAAAEKPPEKTLAEEIQDLKKEYALLRLKIEDEEDEKFIVDDHLSASPTHDTPRYKGLTKSTLDLAMSLKKTLTPGSVTNKTVQVSQL